MGHFSHNCKLTGIPITGGDPAVLIVMKHRKSLYDNSEKSLMQYGSTYMCSNDGTKLKFLPVWYPIMGTYDDYGDLEDVIQDDNTKIIEEFYGLSINEIINIITSSRKDDGYDSALNVIKKPIEYPDDWISGENHITYYSRTQNDPLPFNGLYPTQHNDTYHIYRDGVKIRCNKEEFDNDYKLIHGHYQRYVNWKSSNPDPENDYGKPQYLDRYKELLTYSGMWVHGEVYKKLTMNRVDDYESCDLGQHGILESFGFIKGKTTNKDRYNIPYTKDGYTIYSDGRWLEESIFNFEDFKKHCKKNGVIIDIENHLKKDWTERYLDYEYPHTIIPENPLNHKKENTELSNEFGLTDDDIRFMLGNFNGNVRTLNHVFLCGGNEYRVENDISYVYMNEAKNGKLKKNIVEYLRFDKYMFSCGRYYEIVGTSPQDGLHENVLHVLNVAKEILTKTIEKRNQW